MRVSVTSFGLLAPLLTVILVMLSACGGGQSVAPPQAVEGPALLFFYTDN